MFDFGNANKGQRLAIETVDGPVLITAGPGTGKTYTLVQRAIYLIEVHGVQAEQILIATFTEKAAKELITRITNELEKKNIAVNINEMYIGTFHSICLRIVKEHLEHTKLKKNYRILDQFDQYYTVFQNMRAFQNIPEIETVLSIKGMWQQANQICTFVNTLAEELVDPKELQKDLNPEIVVLGHIFEVYKEILLENNLMDFSAIQTEAYWLLKNNSDVLKDIQTKIQYIMIDEYQDTNYIQEQLVFLLGDTHKNICVVGDDDQGLYRFRGATIRNILEFPEKFSEGECKIIPLVINYRSNSNIVDFYNNWMVTTSGKDFQFHWDKFRYDKTIKPHAISDLKSPAVVKLSSDDNENEWHEAILTFIKELMTSGKISDYNQLAFLFNSVKHERVINLAAYLENNGINVYSPRSDMFFQREEIQTLIGCLILLFPKYVMGLEEKAYKYLQPEHYDYYFSCIKIANVYLEKPESSDFRKWIRRHGKIHADLKNTTDYSFSGLLYQIFEFSPFSKILDIDMNLGVFDMRPVRNLSLFTQITGKFEYLHRIDVFSGKKIDKSVELFFNQYLRLLFNGGLNEYEDDAEYAPSGCVSFLTIHQSKGMEFPVVFVDSLASYPRKAYNEIIKEVEATYFKRQAFEPYEEIKYFDFWRLYYTAFSRAQDLLILTCNEGKRTPSKYFREIYTAIPNADTLDLSEFDFKKVKDVNLKNTFSFTSHINVYETCSLQYKFYKELEFAPVRVSAMLFGILVHQTIEDIHKAAIRKEENLITTENITNWFESNYSSLIKSERTYLAEPQKNAALKQVLRYVERRAIAWEHIQEAEVSVSLVKPDYIIDGKIDLIKGENNSIEIVDFKSEKKPDIFKDAERLEYYRRQLQLYAYLVEKRTNQKVSKMHLYYTGEEDGVPMISYPYQKTAIDATVAAFDDTVQKILKKEYTYRASSEKTCRECDFRFYCGK
ncbi:MAG: ATP-dependent DNA helicase [Spirochaetota bacterium]|nr:ATP-dependent DNA helicase [Spirochaetota bacterium]